MATELPDIEGTDSVGPPEGLVPERPPGPRESSVTDLLEVWGPPPLTASEEIERGIRELQADLHGLVEDVRQGPLERFRSGALAYLSELRRELLRHHRRLAVQMRTAEERLDASDALRRELAELADRCRTIVLGRSSRVSQDGWSPRQLVEAVDRTVGMLPASITTSIEPHTYEDQAGQGPWRALRRAFLRAGRWLRNLFGEEPATRVVELEELARHHCSSIMLQRLEGVVALVSQADAELISRTRLLLDGVVRGYEGLVARAEDDEFADLVRGLRHQVEEELAQVEEDLEHLVRDGTRRTARLLGDAVKAIKNDLPMVGTLDLPSRTRRSKNLVVARDREVDELEEKLVRVRDTEAASYVLLGLHLEYAAFRARVRKVLDSVVAELERDIHGRSHVQLQRVIRSLDEALERLADRPSNEAQPASEEQIAKWLEPFERVLSEAMRAGNQLMDQLGAEQLVAPILDALNREAQNLTDRYRVPAAKIPHAEWKLPDPIPSVEIHFADLVAAYIQTDVAPQLLSKTSRAVATVQPLLSLLQAVDRVVTFDVDRFAPELELEELAREDDGGSDSLRVVIARALGRHRLALGELYSVSETWSIELGTEIRETVLEHLALMRDRLAEGQISRLRGRAALPTTAGRRIIREVNRFTRILNQLGDDSTATVRGLVGEDRLSDWRRHLGLPRPPGEDQDSGRILAVPRASPEVPLFYRRLFATQAYWSGDVLAEQQRSADQVRKVLSTSVNGLFRTAAVVGPDGSGKAALLGAIARGDHWSSVKRTSFSRPASADEVAAMFDDLGQGHLVVVTGMGWLMSARPGGFEPLRRFVEGVVADAGRNAWLIEADDLVWQFAAQCAPLTEVFGEIVRVNALAPGELEAAILARHQLSGFGLAFEESAGTARSENAQRLAKRVAQERYFRALHEASGGLLQVGLLFWLTSIVRVDEDKGFVLLGKVCEPPHRAFERLSEDIQLTLFLVARQGWMDSATLAYLLRSGTAGAEGQLARLASIGALERQNNGTYQIRRHLRSGVARVLSDRGWLG